MLRCVLWKNSVLNQSKGTGLTQALADKHSVTGACHSHGYHIVKRDGFVVLLQLLALKVYRLMNV